MAMQDIRKWYKVPAKRGLSVRDIYDKSEGQITSADGGSYLRVRDSIEALIIHLI